MSKSTSQRGFVRRGLGFHRIWIGSAVIGAAWAAACGNDDTTIPPSTDAGPGVTFDSSSPPSPTTGTSSGNPPPPDSGGGGNNDGGDSGPLPNDSGGVPETGTAGDGATCFIGTGCTTDTGGNGIFDTTCNCLTCDANGATASQADAVCQGAYPGSLCVASSCVTANCRSTTGSTGTPACTGGQICGVTTANQCGPCAATADCVTAYGAGYVCSATGSCVSGGCGTSADCDTGGTAGQLCGVTAPNACGACSSDDQCAADPHYAGAGQTICDSALHTCVSATCGTNLAACDGTHLCCGTTCEPGTTFSGTGNNKSCCGPADCAGNVGFTQCVNNQCSACATVADGKYYVDPANGTDNGSSGGDATGCRFKTLAHAISVASLAAGTKTIYLLGDDDPTTNTGEAFPLALPANTTIVGYDDVGGAPANHKVLVPAGKVGFTLTASGSGLNHLTIDGVNGATTVAADRFTDGVLVGAPGTAPTGIAIDHLTVTHSLGHGIIIGGITAGVTSSATVTIGPGMNLNGAGFLAGTLIGGTAGASPASGLVIGGKSTVTINGGADQSSFSNNSEHGLVVQHRASATINGTAVPGNGDYTGSSIIANANNVAGVMVAQNPSGSSTAGADWTAMGTCAITGMVTMNAPAGNGFRFEGGSKVTLRGSVAYGNIGDGVHVETGGNAGTTKADANWIGAIDLGIVGSAGGNVLQIPYGAAGATYNHGAGICLAIAQAPVTGQTLNARGNTLVTTTDTVTDCSATATVVHSGTCRSGAGAPASVGVTPSKVNANTIDITSCK
jgi:hypothetical protein